MLNKKPQNNLQVTKNRVSDTTKGIAHSSQNLNSVISAANVGDNTRKFAALDHNRTRDYIYQLGKSPINLTSLSKCLSFYPNKSDSIELLKGFQQGVSLNYQGPRLPMQITCLVLGSIHIFYKAKLTKTSKLVELLVLCINAFVCQH